MVNRTAGANLRRSTGSTIPKRSTYNFLGFRQLLLFLCTFLVLLTAQNQPGENKKSVLFIYGGWEGHEPEKCRDLFVPWLKSKGFNVTATPSLDAYLDEDLMNSVDLIIQVYTMSSISPEQEKMLLMAVRDRGVAMAGWHGGLADAFRNNPDYHFMIGGQWVAHPGGTVKYEVNIVDNEDPITRGLGDFTIRSEQYYMHVDPANQVLAETTFSGEGAYWIKGTTVPVVWKKKYGIGRIFYSSLGHNVKVFEIPEAMTIMKRGILWAIGELD